MITRKQYMDKEFSHSEYYGQFVNPAIRNFVVSFFSPQILDDKFKTDQHFNNIPLDKWDAMIDIRPLCGKGKEKYRGNDEWLNNGGKCRLKELVSPALLKMSGEGWSISTATCILKEAARQIVYDYNGLVKFEYVRFL